MAVVLCGLFAYSNSLSGPLVFDDRLTVLENPSIRTFWSTEAFRPTRELPVAGRPLVNLTFAANYAVHGVDVRGYHAVNLLVHLWNALLVAGIVRRTARRRHGDTEAALLAGMVAAVWVVHPLASEAVSYIDRKIIRLNSSHT